MDKEITFKGIDLSYTDRGKGITIVMLHGYLENREIWGEFALGLSKQFRVISMDIPGHGRSGTWGGTHDMDLLAESVMAVMREERVDKVFLIGHSMGGYVTMAFADLFPGSLHGYVLFHSTCFADSEEKRKNRDREISLVMCNRKKQIIRVNVPKAFADDNLSRMKSDISRAIDLAMQNPDDGIVALLHGMKARPDRTAVLQDDRLPLLLVGVMKDNYIPVEVFDSLVELAPHATVVRLEESGHMGFLEETAESVRAVESFIKNNRPAPG